MMKVGLLLVSFLCALSFAHEVPSDVAESAEATELVGGYSSENSRDQFSALGSTASASNLKTVGLSILAAASNRTSDSNYRQIYNSLYSGLSGASIHAPPSGQDFTFCTQSPALAFVMRHAPNDIYLCATLWNNYSQTGYYMAQVLIHEAAHTQAVYNECTATVYEVSAMRVSGVGLAMRNGYMAGCGID